jgi:hypothetical protein
MAAACLTAQFNSVFQRLNAFQSLLHLYQVSEATRAELRKFTGNLSSLNEDRNRIAHDPRFRKEDGSVARFEITAKSALQFGLVPESIYSLREFQEKVAQKKSGFLLIWKKVKAEIEARPGGFHEPLPQIALSELD